ncbi:MAG: acetyl-CoA carboxylase biotin carboxyl carrier protein subunit [Dehalococcoidales bacterium]|nr:acetyl-CoA carboxylase biotin carboxyl carrier protein subunit [Dehalococcoidales bacterium]
MPRERVEFPLTGNVLGVNVTVGCEVTEEDTICILESVKMENPIMAPCRGRIVEINPTPRQVVEAGDVVAVIEC